MDANRGLIPRPERGTFCQTVAGSYGLVEKPVAMPPCSCRPDVSSSVFSTMLALLETLRKLVVSGHEPASYLVRTQEGGPVLMVAGGDGQGLRVSSRAVAGGWWLEVSDESGRTGYRLEQFCRRGPWGRVEALPHCWSRSSASI